MSIETQQDEQEQQTEQAQEEQHEAESETQAAESETEASAEQQEEPQGDDEVVITFGDEPAPTASDDEIEGRPAPQWVKELRKADREKAKRIRELEAAVAAKEAQSAPQAPTVGAKPTLEECDFDAEVYAEKVLEWNEAKRKVEQHAETERKKMEAAQAEWQKNIADYRTAGAELKVAGFEDAEAVVMNTLSQTQYGILVQGPAPKETAQMMAALARSPDKLRKLAGIDNPIKYAFEVAKMVGQLKAHSIKQPPAPEKQVRSSASGATAVDNVLARLQAEADKTGDRSKVAAYIRKQKQAA